MKVYSIYFIQKEFALHFYQKSEILYRFIQSYQRQRQNKELEKQFHYITLDVSKQQFMKHLQESIRKNVKITVNNEQIELSEKGLFITLELEKKAIKIYCQSLSEAESLLFPLLRTFHPYVFVIGNEFNYYKHFGWISPITKTKLHKNDQILYSSG